MTPDGTPIQSPKEEGDQTQEEIPIRFHHFNALSSEILST
jgi:hypothetical protein